MAKTLIYSIFVVNLDKIKISYDKSFRISKQKSFDAYGR